MSKTKVHLGCGIRNFGHDWLHVDVANFDHVKWHDIENLPLKKNSVEIIYTSHMLTYFDRDKCRKLFSKWYEYLKIGGVLRVAVPDFEILTYLYQKRKISIGQLLGPLYGKWHLGPIHEKYGIDDDIFIYMKTAYDYHSLYSLFEDTGFDLIKRWDWRYTEHSHIDDHSQAYIPHMDKKNGQLISLNMQGMRVK